MREMVLAICFSRVIFGNERAFKDAIRAIKSSGIDIELVLRDEPWTDNMVDFFGDTGVQIHRWRSVDLPLKGWIKDFVIEFLPRALTSNYTLYNFVRKTQRRNVPLTILISDASILLGYGLLFRLCNVRVIYRCGSSLPNHNPLWRWIIVPLLKKSVSKYVVDSNFMRQKLSSDGVPIERIIVVRPTVPYR
ncbi:hypothetical protein [Aquidulcibacter sp.]|uniref:hypothetical protein n=1 Tax=Aquidulcibacter sp. TaxID=2052990 RepID=UPI003BA78C88